MENNAWELTFGVFPGLLFGVRSYEYDHEEYTDHVLYLGCFDLCLTVYRE